MAPDIFDANKDLKNSPKQQPSEQKGEVRGHFQAGRRIGQGTSDSSSNPHHKKRHPDEYSQVLAAEKSTSNRFASYAPKPIGISFESQHPDEKILLFLRQHPIVNLPWIFISLLMLVAPIIFISIIPFAQEIPFRFIFVMILGWYLLTAGFVLEQTLMWLFNSFIITDERMIDIDFYSLVYKQMDYAKLDKIQDISSRTGGVLFSLLDVGNIFVQTASEVPEFVFENIHHPTRVTRLLNELVLEEEREQIEGRVS